MQASQQVQLLARQGYANQADTEPLIQSILILDALNTPAVYGGIAGLRSGLSLISQGQLAPSPGEDVEIYRYAMSLLHLQAQLMQDSELFEHFGVAIERLSSHSGDALTTACSRVYQEFISDLRPQIIVQGESNYLQQAQVPEQIRALLLAGIRSAVLWQQKDGSRFKILWQRTRMQNAARSLLTEMTH